MEGSIKNNVPQRTIIKIFRFQNLLGFLKSKNLLGFLKSKIKTIKNPSSIDCPSFKNQSSAELNKFGTEEN